MTSLPRVSRRSLFALAGSGVAFVSAAVVWRGRERGADAARSAAPPLPVVDHDGWIVTPEDKQALASRGETP
jgi:hypothetical protein